MPQPITVIDGNFEWVLLRGAWPSEGCPLLRFYSCSKLHCVHWHQMVIRSCCTIHFTNLGRSIPKFYSWLNHTKFAILT